MRLYYITVITYETQAPIPDTTRDIGTDLRKMT